MRLINADALLRDIEKYHLSDGMFQHWVEVQTTIDAEPMKHGKWMEIIEVNEYGEPYQSGVYCSECGEISIYEPNYCPNCGAKMDAERKEHDTDKR